MSKIVITPKIQGKIKRMAKKFSPKQIAEKLQLAYLTIYSHMRKRGIIEVKSKPGRVGKPGYKPKKRNKKDLDEKDGYFNWRDFADMY